MRTLTLAALLLPALWAQDLRTGAVEGQALDFALTHTTKARITAVAELGAATTGAELTPPAVVFVTQDELAWQDTVRKVDGAGQLAGLERAFGRVSRARRTQSGDEVVQSQLELGPVAGETVRLDRQHDAAWGAAFVPHADETPVPASEWLEGLQGAPVFAGFLPEGEVEVGATWTADLDAWRSLLRPGGALAFRDADGVRVATTVDDAIDAALTGDVRCTLADVADERATITFEVELASSVHFEGELANEDPKVVTQSFTRDIELAGTYAGTLEWDLAAHHARAAHMTGSSTWTIEERTEIRFENDTDWDQGTRQVMLAEHVLDATLTPAD